MRLSPRILLIPVVAVLASLMPAASPALAQSSADVLERSACDLAVCVSVGVESRTELYVKAGANVPAGTCGHFEATVSNSSFLVRTTSATLCLTAPTWYSGVMVPTTNAVTVTVRFISDPPTLGAPLVRV